ncbi:MAG: site-specific DNA-methyltransferase [Thiotrichaceae bacterium]
METIDLIYLDPPFFSNRNYEVIWGDAGEIRSFQDRWSGGIDHYIAWLKERVVEMHRLLKPTGSIFLHCDWHANAYIRVLILDKIFGEQNFMGEIIWQRHNAHNDAKKKLGVLTDSIFYYSKSNKFTYHSVYTKHSEVYKTSFYKYDDKDERGRYQLADMSAPLWGGMSAINKKQENPTVGISIRAINHLRMVGVTLWKQWKNSILKDGYFCHKKEMVHLIFPNDPD